MPDPFMQAVQQALMSRASQTLSEAQARDQAFKQQLAQRSRPVTGNHPDYLQMLPNANAPEREPDFPAAIMGDRLSRGENPMYDQYKPNSLGEMASDIGLAPLVAGNLVYEDEKQLRAQQLAAAQQYQRDTGTDTPSGYPRNPVEGKVIERFNPGMTVAEGDIAGPMDPGAQFDPNKRLLPNYTDKQRRAQIGGLQADSDRQIAEFVAKYGIGPLLEGKTHAEAIEMLGMGLGARRKAELGDLDPSKQVYGL